MEWYFLKSAACLAVLLVFYKLLLERENMHVFKRIYLLASILASLIIPLITFTTYVETSSENINFLMISSEVASEASPEKVNYWPFVFFGIYLMGVLFFSIKFSRNLRILIRKIQTNLKLRSGNFINVLLSEKVQPHTFFSYIFFNRENYLRDEIPKDVKIHEEAHARQKHSVDVLFVELLQIIFWFNPLIFLLKDAIKLNHEFLADREVLKQGISTSGYQQTLLSFSSGDLQSDLVNTINYSSTRLTVFGKTFSYGGFGQVKKRFTVMKTHTSKNGILIRSLLLLPLLAGLLYGFSDKELLEKDMEVPESIGIISEILELRMDEDGLIYLDEKTISLSEIKKLDWKKYTNFSINASPAAPKEVLEQLIEVVTTKRIAGNVSICSYGESTTGKNVVDDLFQEVPQEPATPKMIREFNKLVKHYNSLPAGKRQVKLEDAEIILFIYGRMTPDQKAEAEKINFDIPPPPPETAPQIERNGDKLPPPPPPLAPEALPAPPPPAPQAPPAPPAPPAPEAEHAPKHEIDPGNNVPLPSVSAPQKPNKKLSLIINGQEIIVNGRKTNVQGFAELVDKATSDWTAADYKFHGLEIKTSEGVSESTIKQLNTEMRKTKLAKSLKSDSDYIPYPNSSN